jgi:glyoxylase-like metal-dependent hydrolase (beta-lactamase superfamily II)
MNTAMPNRRTFLKTALSSVASLVRLHAQAGSGTIASTQLAGNLFLLTGAGANVVTRTGPDGVVLVDGGLAEHAGDLGKAVSALPGSGPVRTLFNTHWHPEHTGSNLTLRRTGATIVAHENTRLWLSTDITRPSETRTFQPLPKEALPNRTFYDKGAITVDAEQIEYGYMLQAHTDGDIYVLFPKSNVLVIGDVISGEGWPFIDWWTGGWINGIVSGLDTLLKVANDKTRVIAGQGPVLTRADLESQHKMFTAIAQRLRTMMFGGKNIEDVIAAQPTKEYEGRMGDPKQFLRLAFQSMWGHFTPDA